MPAIKTVNTHLDFGGVNMLKNVLLDVRSSDPSTPGEGQFWYNSSTQQFKYQNAGGTVVLATGTSGQANAFSTITDGTTNATASGGDTLKFRSASNLLSVAVQNNDATHGDNVLLTVNQANLSLTASQVSNLATTVQGYRLDQFAAPTAAVSLNGQKITNLANGTASGDAVAFGQLAAYQPTSEKGAANGYASLDSGGKVPTSQLPASVLGAMQYQGAWNASANSPALASGTGTKGYYYRVSVAGTTTIDGVGEWAVGDWIAFNGTTWDKLDNTDQVTSVAGRQGAVTLTVADVSGAAATANNLSDLANAGTARTNLGLGSMATQAASGVAITGGTISGITDLAVADGGTGASTAKGGRDNLGAVGSYTATIGDGSSTTISIVAGTHNLTGGASGRAFKVELFAESTGAAEEVYYTVATDGSKTITLTFNSAPASNAKRVVIIG